MSPRPFIKLGRPAHLRVTSTKTETSACGLLLGNRNTLRTDDRRGVSCLNCLRVMRRTRRAEAAELKPFAPASVPTVRTYRDLPELPRHKFPSSLESRNQGKSTSEVHDFDGNPINGYKAVGWISNDKLLMQRDDELPEGSVWIAIRYEKEDGSAIWFHSIADTKEIT